MATSPISKKLITQSHHPTLLPRHSAGSGGGNYHIRVSLLTLAILLCLGLVGCAAKVPSLGTPLSTSDIAPSPLPTKTSTPTITPSPQPSNTPSPLPPTLTPIPSLTPSPTPLACWGEPGNKEHASLSSDLLRLPLEYTVYLPPCYDQQKDRRYPVLYLIHGQSYNQDQWDRLGADETADALIAAGEVPPFIIVLPRDRSWAQPTEDMFGQVVAEELVPTIDEGYRTLSERAYRAIGGLSRGAGWAVHLGLSRWELFGAIGGHSLPVFWSDTPYIRRWLKDIPDDALPRIYLDIGEKDRPSILDSAIWFEKLLTTEGIPHEWHLYAGYHEEAYWESHVDEYLRWYADGWMGSE